MYLQRQLAKGFSPGVRERGTALHASGCVTLFSGNQWRVKARVRGSRVYEVELSREKQEIHVFCECAFFESSTVCKHIWATILAADAKNYLLGVMGGPIHLVDDLDGEEEDFPLPTDFYLRTRPKAKATRDSQMEEPSRAAE